MVDSPKRVVAAIQCRMGSRRLPGKALLPIHGRPVIVRIWERLCLARKLDAIVVATSGQSENDVIEAVCTREGIGCVRGPIESDIIDRMRRVVESTSADAVLRVTADCPLTDPKLVDLVVERWIEEPRLDYVSNVFPPIRRPADGLDLELFSAECLLFMDDLRSKREELSRNIWEHPERFRIHHVPTATETWSLGWALDTPRDLSFIRWIWGELPEGFGWKDVLEAKMARPL